MKYFIVSLLFHTLLVVSVSSTIAENSQQKYDISFQSSEKAKSSATYKKDNHKPQPNLAPASNISNSTSANTENNLNNNNQGVISLNGQMGPAQGVFSYLINQIYKNRIYPHECVRLKQQGQVTVKFYINENGDITDIQLANASTYKLLNQAAIKTLRQITINSDIPDVEKLFNRSYSFTFDFEITKSSST